MVSWHLVALKDGGVLKNNKALNYLYIYVQFWLLAKVLLFCCLFSTLQQNPAKLSISAVRTN